MTLLRNTALIAPLACLFMSAAMAASTTVSQVAITGTENEAVFRFTVSAETPIRTFLLSEPLRAVIDLPDASLSASDVFYSAANQGPVRGFRHGRQADGRLRLVLDLSEPVAMERLPDQPLGNDAQTLSFQILARDAALDAAAQAAPVQTVPAAVAKTGNEPAARDDDDRAGPDVSGTLSTDVIDDDASGAAPATTFVFGGTPETSPSGPAAGTASPGDWDLQLHRGLVESGFLYDDARPADGLANLQFIASATRSLQNGFEIRLGARIDGQYETGGSNTLEHLEVEYDESWLRYRADDWRLTVGAQKIIWGRSDEIAPTDRLSTQDFTRLLLDQRADRRRANPAVRLEWFGDGWNADLVWLPVFREGELPQRDSLWYPVDADPGSILGLPDAPQLSALVGNATFNEGASGDGGGGIRVNRFGRGVDYAFSLQRVRNSQPYFRLDESLRQALLGGVGPAPGTAAPPLAFDAVYPRSWVVGGDAGFAVNAWTFRVEAAWSSDMPVTRENLAFDTVSASHWLVGAETFPGDGDLRLTVQLAGMQMHGASGILDQDSTLTLLGEITTPFAANRWRATMRYWIGIEQNETYLNPELVWTAMEPHEFYLGMHLFDGKSRTIGGFYEARDMIVFGWRGRF